MTTKVQVLPECLTATACQFLPPSVEYQACTFFTESESWRTRSSLGAGRLRPRATVVREPGAAWLLELSPAGEKRVR